MSRTTIDLRTILKYLSVGIIGSSYMFEDNKSLVLNSMDVHTKLYYRHNTLFFHRVTESIVTGVCKFYLFTRRIKSGRRYQ